MARVSKITKTGPNSVKVDSVGAGAGSGAGRRPRGCRRRRLVCPVFKGK